MAVKKKASKKKASKKKAGKKKSTGKALMSADDWQKRMTDSVSDESARTEKGTGTYIGIKDSEFTFQGASLGDEMEVIILDHTFFNTWNDAPYNKEEIRIPACIAISKNKEDLAPTENSPIPQSEDCYFCDLNQWGSAETGRGKACGTRRRIAVILSSQLDEDIGDIEIAYISVPPTSMKNFTKYVNGVNKVHKRPSNSVVTSITFDEESEWETLVFKHVCNVDSPEHGSVIVSKYEECQTELMEPPDTAGFEPYEAKKKVRGGPPNKKKSKKKKGKFSK